MSKNTKLSIIVTAVVVVLVAAAIAVFLSQRPAAPTPAANPDTSLPATMRADTHVMGEPGDGTVTLVEFLDFECEACAGFYPEVEQLKKDFAGEVTFAFRYFPLPSHGNSVNAAVAVEAAARQNMLQPMYALLFETQATWGEKGDVSQAPLFRLIAEQIGLDMAQYDADVKDPSVFQQIQNDFDEGVALGVKSTPTFFLNDRMLELGSYEELRTEIEAELAR